jgi:hypothetical protein
MYIGIGIEGRKKKFQLLTQKSSHKLRDKVDLSDNNLWAGLYFTVAGHADLLGHVAARRLGDGFLALLLAQRALYP